MCLWAVDICAHYCSAAVRHVYSWRELQSQTTIWNFPRRHKMTRGSSLSRSPDRKLQLWKCHGSCALAWIFSCRIDERDLGANVQDVTSWRETATTRVFQSGTCPFKGANSISATWTGGWWKAWIPTALPSTLIRESSIRPLARRCLCPHLVIPFEGKRGHC